MASSPDSLYEPLPRRGHSVCEFNKKLYLIGGEHIPTSSVDIFDPVTHTWKQEKTKGQAPPSICCSASTVLNQQAFFFGGHSERVDDYHNDLWALDLISLTWERIPQKDQVPYARYCAGLVLYRDMLILYGGLSKGHAFDDIHLFNPKDGTWTSKDVTGTPPPELIGFTFTQMGQQAVLFGGRQWKNGKKTYVNDVYSLDLEKWHWSKKTTIGTAQPHGRYQHAACSIDTTHLLVSGGWDGHEYDDSWILDLQLMRWRKVELPDGAHAVKRSCHAMAAVVTAEGVQILYFGGYVTSNDFFATTAVLSMALQSSHEPARRWGHSVCEFNKKLYLVGGKDIPTSSVDIFDPATLTWKNKKTEGPTPSSIHCSAFTMLDHKAFFFGGYDDKGDCHNELWVLDLELLQWEKIPQNGQPHARRNAGLVGYQDKLILYGGKSGGHTFKGIHVFNLKEGTWTKPQICETEPSASAGFTFTRVGHQVVLFGGCALNDEQNYEYANDVYTFDLDKLQWTKKTIASTAQPCGRSYHAACAIDSVHLLVTGGRNDMAIDDLWLLNLQSMEWKEVTPPCGGVVQRCHALATVVTDEGAQILYFGGFVGRDVVAATILFSSETSLPVVASESVTPKPANKTEQLFTVLSSTRMGKTKEWSVVDYITTQQSDQWKERVEQLQQKLGGSVPEKTLLAKETRSPCLASTLGAETPKDAAGSAPTSHKLCWEEKQLKVHFMNKIPTWRLTTPPEDFISTTDILKWANIWSSEELGLKGIVPEFVPCYKGEESESDIRVQISADVGSWSYIGTNAKSYQDGPTMVLDLAKEDDDYRQYTVIHEFGHALGLGHEHQTSRLAGVVDKQAMINYLKGPGVSMTDDQAEKKFDEDYGQYSKTTSLGVLGEDEFDPLSVMCYPIPAECIKESHRNQFTPEQLERMTTMSYDKRKTLSLIDKNTVKKLYSHVATPIKDFPRSPPLSPEWKPVAALGDQPTMPKLMAFESKKGPVYNILERIGSKYSALGTHLLQDNDGSIVHRLEQQYQLDSPRINKAILMYWLQGKGEQPTTWKTLIAVLKNKIKLINLATDIDESLYIQL